MPLEKGIVKVIRDPIHGYIGVNKEELSVIELPIFQRLRFISQVSFANLVYPSAFHTRFAHSIGTMYICGRFGEYLRREYGIKEDVNRILRLTGLLHDIGHCPFSHVFEPFTAELILKDGEPWEDAHVRLGQKVIMDPKYKIIKKIGEETAHIISQLIGEGYKGSNISQVCSQIIKGVFSADRLDYLCRDTYHTGALEYAIIDIERIIRSVLIYHDDIIYSKKGLYALEGAILSYFFMYRAIYYHHATRAAISMFEKILWDFFDKEGRNLPFEDSQFFVNFTDYVLLSRIYQSKSKDLLDSLLKRELPKCLLGELDFSEHVVLCRKIIRLLANDYQIKRRLENTVERKIKEKLKVDSPYIFIDTPSFVAYPSHLSDPVIAPDPKDVTKNKPLSEFSPHVKALRDVFSYIPRVYLDRKSAEKLQLERHSKRLRFKEFLINTLEDVCKSAEKI